MVAGVLSLFDLIVCVVLRLSHLLHWWCHHMGSSRWAVFYCVRPCGVCFDECLQLQAPACSCINFGRQDSLCFCLSVACMECCCVCALQQGCFFVVSVRGLQGAGIVSACGENLCTV